MSVKALQGYTSYSKYAKYLPEEKRRERWSEQVDRGVREPRRPDRSGRGRNPTRFGDQRAWKRRRERVRGSGPEPGDRHLPSWATSAQESVVGRHVAAVGIGTRGSQWAPG